MNCKLVSDLKEKANRFNEFVCRHCIPLNNDSESPSQPIFVTDKGVSSVAFDKDIIKIIRALNINKSNDHDISIRMIKIGDSALVKSFPIIFNNCVRTGTFPYIWEKSVVPVHKKCEAAH